MISRYKERLKLDSFNSMVEATPIGYLQITPLHTTRSAIQSSFQT